MEQCLATLWNNSHLLQYYLAGSRKKCLLYGKFCATCISNSGENKHGN